MNRAQRRAAGHRGDRRARHNPYAPRAVAYDVEVSFPTVAGWNDGDFRRLREAYGEPECVAELRPIIAATRPRNPAFEDLGVFSVAHYELGCDSEQMVSEAVHRCFAMMDEKHGEHWRPGDVFILAAPETGQPECPPGFECGDHRVCVSCGDTIHLGPSEASPGFVVDEDAMVSLIVGNPPRCADCRGFGS